MKEYTKMFEYSDENDIRITEALGISDKRESELKCMLPEIIHKNDRVSQTLEAIWNAVDHPNEFAWLVFIYGANTGVNTAKKTDFMQFLMDKFKEDLGDE